MKAFNEYLEEITKEIGEESDLNKLIKFTVDKMMANDKLAEENKKLNETNNRLRYSSVSKFLASV